MEQIGDLFVGMGYEVAEGPEVELEWTNFDALNIPADHPARGLMDTFHVAPPAGAETPAWCCAPTPRRCRRAPCSPASRRSTWWCPAGSTAPTSWTPPTRPVFHQVEGLVVDKGITMAHLRGHPRPLRPGHVRRRARRPAGGRTTSRSPSRRRSSTCGSREHRDGPRWVEWGGCGMVNPRVLRACGIDPEVYSGFAFGMGIDRTLMFRQRGQRHAGHGRGRRAVHPRVRAVGGMRYESRDGGLSHASLSLAAGVRRPAGRPARRAIWNRPWSTSASRSSPWWTCARRSPVPLVVGRGPRDRGADRFQEADPVLPGRRRRRQRHRRAAGDRLRGAQLRRRRPGRGDPARRGAARRTSPSARARRTGATRPA